MEVVREFSQEEVQRLQKQIDVLREKAMQKKPMSFIASGMMGDFIHSLYAVKNICRHHNLVADIYLTDKILTFGGDAWKFGTEKALNDIKDLVMAQPYINSFQLLPDNFTGAFINLNNWRISVTEDVRRDGIYSRSWSEFMSEWFRFDIPKDYAWLEPAVQTGGIDLSNKVIVHRSIHRHNDGFPWKKILDSIGDDIIFLTCSEKEWDLFPYKGRMIMMKVDSITEMYCAISQCKYFIGNQSAPFALASALDKPRMVELDIEPGPFYMNETKYSDNISWYLNDDKKYLANNSIVNI